MENEENTQEENTQEIKNLSKGELEKWKEEMTKRWWDIVNQT